jgi:hypothetical protein
MNFYVTALLSVCLVVIPAIVSFKKDNQDKYRWLILSVSIAGALLAFVTGYNVNKESQKNKTEAHTNDSLYKSLLNKNLVSAYTILDSVNIANSSLTKQLKLSAELQKTVFASEYKLLGNLKNVNNEITGGTNVPVLSFVGNNGQIQCDISNHGKLPIRNLSVSVRITKMIYFTKNPSGGLRSNDPRASTGYEKNFGDMSINSAKNIFSLAGSDCNDVEISFNIKWINGNYDGWFNMHYVGAIPKFDKFVIYRHSPGLNLKNKVTYNGKVCADILP